MQCFAGLRQRLPEPFKDFIFFFFFPDEFSNIFNPVTVAFVVMVHYLVPFHFMVKINQGIFISLNRCITKIVYRPYIFEMIR